jgi:Pericentrin-AKAP-450 domain of centrosomal targeting protein
MVQIGYLKSKYTRENIFRQELAYQKQYLLLVLSKLRDRLVFTPTSQLVLTWPSSDLPILAAIARDGDLSISGPPPPKRSIRRIVHIVMFLNRAKKAAKQWAEHNDAREQLAVALQDVRRRRAANGGRRSIPDDVRVGADVIR